MDDVFLSITYFSLMEKEWRESMTLHIPDPALKQCLEREVNGSNLIKRELNEKTLANIRYLNCNSHQIQDLTGIEGCKNLEVLYLADNKLRDLVPLSNCNKLEILDLSMNPHICWNLLKKPFYSVKHIYLRSCHLMNDHVLNFFPKAIKVSLFHNQIQHIEQIYELALLESIDLLHNPISEEELEIFYNQTGVGMM